MTNVATVSADLSGDSEKPHGTTGPDLLDITPDARQHPDFAGHELVLAVRDPTAGLDAIIAIHDMTPGPALGGCRFAAYPSHTAALGDVLRLSKAMTYKAALAGLDLGGGKTVVLAAAPERTPAMFRALGRAIDALGGRYITGEDVGTSVREMDWIAAETNYVIGTSWLGDPSPTTAAGVVAAMQAAIRHRFGGERLDGVTVAVQGLGNVGRSLCEQLVGEGVRLVIADIDPTRCKTLRLYYPATQVDPSEIHRVAADIFAPCALGAVLNDRTSAEMRCSIVVGAANNQLDRPEIADRLRQRGILYAPDYVVNAGGLISAVMTRDGHMTGGPTILSRVHEIGDTLVEIFRRADASSCSPVAVADAMAKERIERRRAAARSSQIERSSA